MTLTTTPGSAHADSFADVAEADAYHAARGGSAWAGLDTDKEAALRRATSWIEGRYRGRWSGYRLNGRAQSLDWPRGNAQDRDGYIIDSTAIPDEIINATCEAALRELVSPGSLSPDVIMGDATVLTGVDSIRWTPLRTTADALDMAPTLTIVDGILSGILTGGGSAIHLVRA